MMEGFGENTDTYCMFVGITIDFSADKNQGSHYFTVTMTKDKTYIYSQASSEGLFSEKGYLSIGVECNTIDLLDLFIKIFVTHKLQKPVCERIKIHKLSSQEEEFLYRLFSSPLKITGCTGETIGIYKLQ